MNKIVLGQKYILKNSLSYMIDIVVVEMET